jgi:hypothetical protein
MMKDLAPESSWNRARLDNNESYFQFRLSWQLSNPTYSFFNTSVVGQLPLLAYSFKLTRACDMYRQMLVVLSWQYQVIWTLLHDTATFNYNHITRYGKEYCLHVTSVGQDILLRLKLYQDVWHPLYRSHYWHIIIRYPVNYTAWCATWYIMCPPIHVLGILQCDYQHSISELSSLQHYSKTAYGKYNTTTQSWENTISCQPLYASSYYVT